VVADVGAGRGYLTDRLALAVGPHGRVVATDIDESALAAIAARPRPSGSAPVTTQKVAPDRPGLARGAYDLILLAEVDHLLPDRTAYLALLRPALAARGRLAVSNRQVYRARLVSAAAQAGFMLIRESSVLPGQFLAIFEPALEDKR